jgi:cobalt/nickel transport system ATP-binding protein
MIDIQNASFSYPDNCALRKTTLHVKKGEAVAVMGSNGSGKSTLLKLINGLVFPDCGTYHFNTEEISRTTMKDSSFSKSFHQKIGFVFQNSDTQLFCASVFDEIAFGPRQMGLEEKEVDERVRDCLELLGIQKLSIRQSYHLSGGEKRKVALACVLSTNPDLLVLDEPMNGLDPKTQRWLVEILVKMNHAGKTLITATHNIELVQEISRRAVLFDETHTIVADAPTEKILEDIDLLKRVNLVDEYYHFHAGAEHRHFHIHNY